MRLLLVQQHQMRLRLLAKMPHNKLKLLPQQQLQLLHMLAWMRDSKL